ncbi:hypothetical protein L6452_27286 [Arctium lappa]|uniref:Uncharacterized protein n=1 Tax=Arctium lappa TaxID=4217 RepID=A0ACB8ZVK7_ARCLA|nr:hypothetical protein L6452_27286 [Arctium lappa]
MLENTSSESGGIICFSQISNSALAGDDNNQTPEDSDVEEAGWKSCNIIIIITIDFEEERHGFQSSISFPFLIFFIHNSK